MNTIIFVKTVFDFFNGIKQKYAILWIKKLWAWLLRMLQLEWLWNCPFLKNWGFQKPMDANIKAEQIN